MTVDVHVEKPRDTRAPDLKRILAAAVSLAIPGGGHFLYGYFCRGILWAALRVLFSLSFPLTMVIGVYGSLLVGLGAAIDTVRIADRRPGWKSVVSALLAFLVMVSVANLALRAYYVRAYKIPSEGMAPTLLVGDFLFANEIVYRTHAPRRGDIVVFRYPLNPAVDYIKRCVAVEGQTVAVVAKEFYVDGVRQVEPYIRHSDARVMPRGDSPRDNFGPVKVPKGSIFVMGDERDNSFDSRFWGPLSVALVRGRAEFLYWSWDSARGGPRLDRIGRLLRAD